MSIFTVNVFSVETTSQLAHVEIPNASSPSLGLPPDAFSAGAVDAAPTCCIFAFALLLTSSFTGEVRSIDAPCSNAPSSDL